MSKGNRSAKGIRVRAQSREVRKSGYPGGADGSLSSSSQADVRISVLDRPEGIPDAVSSGGAGRHHIRAFSSGSQSDGDVSRRHICDHFRHQQGIYPVGALRYDFLTGCFHGLEAPHAGADDDAHPVGILRFHGKAGIFHSFQSRSHSILGKKLHSPGRFRVQPALRVKILHFRRDFYFIIRRIKFRDRSDAHLSGPHACPESFRGVSDGSHRAQTRHHNSSFHLYHPPLFSYIAMPPSTESTWPVI